MEVVVSCWGYEGASVREMRERRDPAMEPLAGQVLHVAGLRVGDQLIGSHEDGELRSEALLPYAWRIGMASTISDGSMRSSDVRSGPSPLDRRPRGHAPVHMVTRGKSCGGACRRTLGCVLQ